MGLVPMISQALALGGLTGARPFLTLGLLSLYARYTLGAREDLWATSCRPKAAADGHRAT